MKNKLNKSKKNIKRNIKKTKKQNQKQKILQQFGGKFKKKEYNNISKIKKFKEIGSRISIPFKSEELDRIISKIPKPKPIPDDGNCTYTALSIPLGVSVKDLRKIVATEVEEYYLFILLCCLYNMENETIESIAKPGRIPFYPHNRQIIIDYLNSNYNNMEKTKSFNRYFKGIPEEKKLNIIFDKDEAEQQLSLAKKSIGEENINMALNFMRFIISIDNPKTNEPINYRDRNRDRSERFIGFNVGTVHEVLGFMMLDETYELPVITKHFNLCIIYINAETISLSSFGHDVNDDTKFIIFSVFDGHHTNLYSENLYTYNTLPDEITTPLLRSLLPKNT